MRARQLSFLPPLKIQTALHHGGDLGKGRRKTRRPFDPKRPLHVVLRASRAKGAWSLLHPRHEARVERELRRVARKYRVRIYRSVNVGNHLHLLVQARKKTDFQSFLRVITGAIAFLVTGTRKGAPIAGGRFWDALAYSRVVTWGREFESLRRYLVKNLFEARGFWNRERDAHLELIWVSMTEAGLGPPTCGTWYP